MKWVIGIALCSCMFPAMVRAQQPSTPVILSPDRFDEWGNIPFNDEKAHLDKIAAQAKLITPKPFIASTIAVTLNTTVSTI